MLRPTKILAQTGKLQAVKKLTLIVAIALVSLLIVAPQLTYAGSPFPGPSPPLTDSCGNNATACLQNNPIIEDVKTIIRFLTAGVGVAIAATIIISGIRYITAGADAGAVSSAKKHIVEALIALLLFLFMAALLEWLTPGTLF